MRRAGRVEVPVQTTRPALHSLRCRAALTEPQNHLGSLLNTSANPRTSTPTPAPCPQHAGMDPAPPSAQTQHRAKDLHGEAGSEQQPHGAHTKELLTLPVPRFITLPVQLHGTSARGESPTASSPPQGLKNPLRASKLHGKRFFVHLSQQFEKIKSRRGRICVY